MYAFFLDITQAGRHRVEVSAPFFLVFFIFVSHLICKINLIPRYLWCLDSRVASTSNTESVGPGSISGGRVLNFFSFSFFSSFQSRMIYQNKSVTL